MILCLISQSLVAVPEVKVKPVKRSFVGRCTKVLGLLALTSIATSGGLLAHQALSNGRIKAGPVDRTVLDTKGASVTSGTTASLSLLMRMRYHLQEHHVDLSKLMGKKKIVVMIDYFFPSKFPQIGELERDELARAVEELVLAERRTHDYVVVGELVDVTKLSERVRTLLQKNPQNPIQNIDNFLSPTEAQREKIQLINQTLERLSLADPQIIVARMEGLATAMATNEYKSPEGFVYRADELSEDRLHLNDNGQAALFNLSIQPALDQIPELSGKIPKMGARSSYARTIQFLNGVTPLHYVSSDFQQIAIDAQVRHAKEFLKGESGDYYALLNSKAKQRLTKNGVEVFDGSMKNRYVDDLESLRKIHENIKSMIGFAASGFVVSRRDDFNPKVLNANLSQVLFFTSIDLVEEYPRSSTYEGYGYDFWSSVDRDHPPRVNYYWEASINSEHPSQLDFVWRVYPLIRNESGKIIQPDPLIRAGTLPKEWREFLKSNGDDIPHLEFRFSTPIK